MEDNLAIAVETVNAYIFDPVIPFRICLFYKIYLFIFEMTYVQSYSMQSLVKAKWVSKEDRSNGIDSCLDFVVEKIMMTIKQ